MSSHKRSENGSMVGAGGGVSALGWGTFAAVVSSAFTAAAAVAFAFVAEACARDFFVERLRRADGAAR
jgi:mannose/fructose/N-acetylgalactosamine-specific phosphotransferase system component IIC